MRAIFRKIPLDAGRGVCYNSKLREKFFLEFCHARDTVHGREERVLEELTAKKKVVGLKQTRRAVTEGCAEKVYVARDADPALTEPLLQLCRSMGVCAVEVGSMKMLGRACAIAVGTAAAAVVAK